MSESNCSEQWYELDGQEQEALISLRDARKKLQHATKSRRFYPKGGGRARSTGSRRGGEPPVRRRNAIEGEELLVKLKEHEMEVELEVDAGVPQAKNAKNTKSTKRKVIRVE